MLEIKEVLRLWQAGVAKQRIAAQLGIDPKMVRRYVQVAVDRGLTIGGELVDDAVEPVVVAVRTVPERARGGAWATCVAERSREVRGGECS